MKDLTFYQEQIQTWEAERKDREHRIAEMKDMLSGLDRQIDAAIDQDDSSLVEELTRKQVDLEIKIDALERINDRKNSKAHFNADELRDANNECIRKDQAELDKALSEVDSAFMAYMNAASRAAKIILKSRQNRACFLRLAGLEEYNTQAISDFRKVRAEIFAYPVDINRFAKEKPGEAADIRRAHSSIA